VRAKVEWQAGNGGQLRIGWDREVGLREWQGMVVKGGFEGTDR